MSTFEINLLWSKKTDQEYKYEIFDRNHSIYFGGNQTLINSASPEFYGSKEATNPEELLAASLASCHMMTFLAITSKSGYVVEQYKCRAVAKLGKNEQGKMAVLEIDLYPQVNFSGTKIPDEAQLKSLHEKSHNNCFIAQSIKSKINIF